MKQLMGRTLLDDLKDFASFLKSYITLQDVDDKNMFYGMSISEPKLYKDRFEAECEYEMMLEDEE